MSVLQLALDADAKPIVHLLLPLAVTNDPRRPPLTGPE